MTRSVQVRLGLFCAMVAAACGGGGGGDDSDGAASDGATLSDGATGDGAASDGATGDGAASDGGVDAAPSTAAPTVMGVSPTGPANANAPMVHGTAVPGAAVAIFANGDCSGSAQATGVADGSGGFSITVSVADNTTTTFAATATAAPLGPSACSSTTVSYVEDSAMPQPPAFTATNPPSPAQSQAPSLLGTTEAGAAVRIYSSSTCSGTALTMGTADGNGAFSIAVSVLANATATFYASAQDLAGNVSGCSLGMIFINDQVAAEPTFTGVSPAPLANHNQPTLSGTSEVGATVQIFADPACATTALGSGSAGDGTFSIQVTVADDTTNTFYARATDLAGNVSACSASYAGYVEDSTAPPPPTVSHTVPASPANDNFPLVVGSAELGAIITLHLDDQCASAPMGSDVADTAGAFAVYGSVADDDAVEIFAAARDGAGNLSACSSTSAVYREDSTNPSPPSLTGTQPGSPATDATPEVAGTSEAGASIAIYRTADCSGAADATATADLAGAFSVVAPATANAVTQFRAVATDTAGNPSACSSPLAYTHDTLPPDPPTLSSTSPASPSNVGTPEVTGSTEAGALVRVYGGACSGLPLATVTADGSGWFTVGVTVPENAVTQLRATAEDPLGNLSGCSTALAFTEDSIAPPPPTVTAIAPTTPSNDNAPTLSGTSVPVVTINAYGDALCAGPSLGSGSSSGSYTIGLAVADNTQTSIHATATDAAGNESTCSTSFRTYVEQSPSSVPSIAGVVSYAGPATGRIYVNVIQDCVGCNGNTIAGTSVPGPGPFLIRGVQFTGAVRVEAVRDTLGTQALGVVSHPRGSVDRNLTGSSMAGVDLTLTDPTLVAPPAPAAPQVIVADGIVGVVFEAVRDGDGLNLASHYLVTATPTSGASITRLVPSGITEVAILHVPNGDYTFTVAAVVGGFSTTSPATAATVGPLVGGHAVTSEVTVAGVDLAGGTLFCAAQQEPVLRIGYVDDPTSPQSCTVAGVDDGLWQLVAFVDLDGDGLLEIGEPNLFDEDTAATVTVASADLDGPALEIPVLDSEARVVTEHRFGPPEEYAIYFQVQAGLALPVRASIGAGPNLPTAIDMPVDQRGRFFVGRNLGATAPTVGDAYSITVEYSDGAIVDLPVAVTGVIAAAATPVAPVGAVASTQPTFSWTAPDPAPPGPYRYHFYVWRPTVFGVWSTDAIPSGTLSVPFNFDNRSQEDPLVGATEYSWELTTRDADGNWAMSRATFTTP